MKIAFLLAALMFFTLVISRKMTVFKSGPTSLPFNYFVICCSWVPFSSAWMLWNEEARTFTFRRLCKIKDWIMNHKGNRIIKVNQSQNEVSLECDVENICLNQYARNIINSNKVVGQTMYTDSQLTSLPGAVY